MRLSVVCDSVLPYIKIARIDHWFKNIFVLPGVFAAFIFIGEINFTEFYVDILLGLLSTCLAASANYTINEYLDAESDRKHPTKKQRPAALGKIVFSRMLLQYFLLAAIAAFIAYQINIDFLLWTLLLLLMGVFYNVPPVRTKDRAHLDILSESVNNPIRFLLGWHLVAANVLAPSSVLIAYWMGGAFLMTVKRMAEYRAINNPTIAGEYRRSFQFYNVEKLLVASFFYAICSSFFLAIFLVKYRIEYLLCFPLFATLFAWYLTIGLATDSKAQTPEKLYLEKRFVAFCVLLALVFTLLTAVDIPALRVLTEPIYY